MEDPLDNKAAEDIKEALENNNQALAVAKIQEYLEKKKNTPLNIAVTGESGSGKSSFVNAFRGLDDGDEGAAPTGCVETTIEVTAYPHPNFPNVTLWDLPGIGTPNFLADKYLQDVNFERFDFFIIVSSNRFRENDVKLALEIQKMKKKFYFVRSKIDNDLDNEERKMKRKKSQFNAEKILKQIRENCTQGLQQQGVKSPQVFLVSSLQLELHDFPLLGKTLGRELPAHKRHALLLAMPNISLEVINKKKEAFQYNIKYWALLSAAGAAIPVPGLSLVLDVEVLVVVVTGYVSGFGLDIPSLRSLANRSNVPLDDLMKIIVSPLAAKKITRDLVLKALLPFGNAAKLMAAEEVSRFIPIFGIPVAMVSSFVSTYSMLNTILNMLAEDAQRVFELALGLETSV
ncbi:interferon-inducible GTPase 5-like [Centropristis striata]|uniref:interferon-inducible GTPase 5-like n=1 Tax=Centropristis striata TaxID=184440 RepID=UPI0027E0EC0F|nr:interferon-inducible GTPase 5-like [Centropristis striata]